MVRARQLEWSAAQKGGDVGSPMHEMGVARSHWSGEGVTTLEPLSA